MKPDKSLEQILESVRSNVILAYKLLQSQNADGLSKVMSELGMQNFSLSYYSAEYEFESRTLEAEWKRQKSVTYMENREANQTEKNSEAIALQKWNDLHKEFLVKNKAYRLAKNTHSDIDTLIDIMRSRLAILRQEMSNASN